MAAFPIQFQAILMLALLAHLLAQRRRDNSPESDHANVMAAKILANRLSGTGTR